MKRIFKDNLKRITALLLVVTMVMSSNTLVFAVENDTNNDNKPAKESAIEVEKTDEAEKPESSSTPKTVEDPVTEEEKADKVEETGENGISTPTEKPAKENEDADKVEEAGLDITPKPAQKPALMAINASKSKARMLASAPESDEAARERECMPSSPDYLKKFLTYLNLKYPDIEINPEFGADGGDKTLDSGNELYNLYNATKMKLQTTYNKIEINGNEYPELTKNMVQFKYLGNFGGQTGSDERGDAVYSDTVKTLIIRNVDEIRNLYVPASVETLIIENTTINCYKYPSDSPGFQCGMLPGDLKYCKNLKKLVIKNVKFGDNYKHPEIEVGTWGSCPYETSYVLNLQNCTNLEELEIDVSFDGAEEVQLAIDGGNDNLFEKLRADKCKINPAPGTGRAQVSLYANENSNISKYYNSTETVEFKNKQFRLWLLEAIGVDLNRDGVISQAELDAIETLTINDQTAHYAKQTSLSAFHELADIGLMHGLKTLEIDFYDPSSYSEKGNRHPL
ncbi:MAG: hypothetical protein Q4E51_09180, partial [Lachnospiraceae bacterium]|nr:hypothetical protein [Lachnospiraceae bacterium]